MDYNQIAWVPLGLGVTVLGLIASFLAWRGRGAVAGLRGAAWSLLPLALVLTGVTSLLWTIGVAVGRFAVRFAFSPTVWAGVVVAAVALVLFLATGVARRRSTGRAAPAVRDRAPAGRTRPGATSREVTGERRPAVEPGKPGRPGEPGGSRTAGGDDDFAEIEEILRRRGIS